MVAEIESNILQVTQDNDSANRAITKGSDEYLDRANEQRARFEDLTQQLSTLNDVTIRTFNQHPRETYGIVESMRTLHDACARNLVSLKNSDFAEALQKTIESFEDEINQLEENISDFIVIQDELPYDEELQSLLSQL